ncbi:hypothetical protein EJ04DRAFT_580275 [Polyplosphaeria fusca]|uniref:Uncharacterized protein n=1 Tax=Polyplosphaeria fusca TaxID=682080 RepID=A0A9P4UX33_9PLEO|nr:hypothetical protein EJ04DRAFT_580275 [Polyplosphaeria fusca]
MATSAPLPTEVPSIETLHIDPAPASIPTISPELRARWGPRWTSQVIISTIAQYAIENGWVEGTVWQWSQSQTTEDDIVFHTALDAMAATLHRSKTLFTHSPAFKAEDSIAAAKEVRNVDKTMGYLLAQFRMIRPLETNTQAYNVGVGMEEHYKLFCAFENAVRQKLVGEGLEQVEKAFESLNKNFESTIVVFKGKQDEKVELKVEVQQEIA